MRFLERKKSPLGAQGKFRIKNPKSNAHIDPEVFLNTKNTYLYCMYVVFFKHGNSTTRRCFSVTAKFIECFGENTFQFVPHIKFSFQRAWGSPKEKK